MGRRRLLVRTERWELFVKHRISRGFTLIELMIALAVAASLLVLAAPSYAVWVADAQIRAAAESIVSGLRYAQAEAIKRNEPVEFVLDPTVGTGGWRVRDAAGIVLQVGAFVEGAPLAKPVTTPVPARTNTFNSLGGITSPNADLTAPVTVIAVSHNIISAPPVRQLNVLIGGGRTGIKVCDPAVSDNTSPRFCTT